MHDHDHFSGFKDPGAWAFILGLIGTNFALVYAEERRWISHMGDGITESLPGLLVGTLFATLVLWVKHRIEHRVQPHHECEHDHDHPHHHHDH